MRLTQAMIKIIRATMIYKASTFRLRSYKAYMRIINIPIRRKNKISIVSKDFRKNRHTTNDHLNHDGLVLVKGLQVVTTR